MDFWSLICYAMDMREKEARAAGGGRGQPDDKDNASRPLFGLGQVVGTPGALQALENAGQHHAELFTRHLTGDWGDL